MALEPATLLLSVAMAVAAGLVGCFAVMRRMSLAADAISHVALPGIGVALALGFSPLVGALVALLLGTTLIWSLEKRTRLATETLVGVVFSAALAAGSLMSSGEELIEALFGGTGGLSSLELLVGILGPVGVTTFLLTQRSALVLTLVSKEIAHTSGVHVPRLNLAYLLAFALTIALGLRYLGVLLMGSLIIIPAATARKRARSLNEMLLAAVTLAVFATIVGISIAHAFDQPAGPSIICVAALLFFAIPSR